ncbi:hypothetical protein HYV69_02565 [Candidatus Uhrbacteria bacterium]|nr:hypothetical protein [Candidatus Uhrbacteria bacterium]
MQETQLKIENQEQKKAIPDARIFTMPEQYRHGKETKVVEPKIQQKPSSSPISPATSQPLPKSVPILQVKKEFSSSTKALLIAGAVILLALIVVGYILLRTSQPKTESQIKPTSETQPTPRPEPEPIPAPEPEPEPAVESPFTNEIVPGKDSDSDGLTDIEETIIYKTNPNLPDTDLDGFLDGNEVFHLYNPSAKSPGTLLEAGFVSRTTIQPNIELMYPSIWETQAGENLSVSIITTTGETFAVSVISQTQEAFSQTISNWIEEQGGQENVVKTTTKTGKEFYTTQDKRSAIVVIGTKVLSFKYDVSTKTTVDYVQTFQMIINSLKEVVL